MEINTIPVTRLIVQLTVHPEDWNAFMLMMSAVKECVKKEGPENVLLHEVYYQKDTYNCLMVESYKNEEAMLKHLELATPVSDKFKVRWKVNSLELMGDCSLKTVELWKRAAVNGRFSYYKAVIKS